MSRGFDGFEIDDFHSPDRDVNRSPDPGARSGWHAVRRLVGTRDKEERADQLTGKHAEPLAATARLSLARSGSSVLARTSRTNYADGNRIHQLRDPELHALTEVGKFRVVTTSDLAQFAYNGNSSRMQNDLANLSHQGLVKQTSIIDSDLSPGSRRGAHQPWPQEAQRSLP